MIFVSYVGLSGTLCCLLWVVHVSVPICTSTMAGWADSHTSSSQKCRLLHQTIHTGVEERKGLYVDLGNTSPKSERKYARLQNLQSILCCYIGQNKSQSYPRFKKWGNTLQFLARRIYKITLQKETGIIMVFANTLTYQ